MTTHHDIKVSPEAVRQGRACGLHNDTESRVRGLARASVPHRHPAGNRIYGPFVLYVKNHEVLSVVLTGPRAVDPRPVSACKLCHGLMVRRVATVIDGREGECSRPCPRAFDSSQPLCDTLTRRIDP